MAALTIFIIRHAEKPGESWPGPGLTPAGVSDKKSLVIRGWQRAGSWAGLFGGGFNDLDYPRPSVIYAADPNSAIADEPSQRPYETDSDERRRFGSGNRHLESLTSSNRHVRNLSPGHSMGLVLQGTGWDVDLNE